MAAGWRVKRDVQVKKASHVEAFLLEDTVGALRLPTLQKRATLSAHRAGKRSAPAVYQPRP